MADLGTQIAQAKQAGYSEDEITAYLGKNHPELAPKIQQAQKAGYAPGEILSYLGKAPTQQQPQPDLVQKALDYRTGNNLVDAPLGVVQGAAKGLLSTAYGGANLLRKIPGVAAADDALRGAIGEGARPTEAEQQQITAPRGVGQGTGKFLEQTAEYAAPAGAAAKLTKGAGVLARAGAQAAVGAGVSGLQTGGDTGAVATGAALGAGGELASAALSGAKALVGAKAPTLANFAESFGGATPTQKARISKALPTLQRDGIMPGADVHEMQDAIKGKLGDIGQAYQNLDPAIKQRQADPSLVIGQLQKAQDAFTRRGVVTDEPAFNALQKQIDTVGAIAQQNGGKITIDDILHLKQNANGRVNFNSPDAEKNLWKTVGDAYRSAADTLAPETTPLNKDYARYKDLEQVIDQNIDRGKGITPSGLDLLKAKIVQHGAGAAIGGAIGHQVAGPIGGAVGTTAGAIFGPKLAHGVAQALQNAVDNGAFQSLTPAKQSALKIAAKVGDNAAVLRLLGTSATEAASTSR